VRLSELSALVVRKEKGKKKKKKVGRWKWEVKKWKEKIVI